MGMLLHRHGVDKEKLTKLSNVTPVSEEKPVETAKKRKKTQEDEAKEE